MLNRKGYSGELAVRVVREVLAVDADELADIEGGGGGAVGVRHTGQNNVVGGGRYEGPNDVVVGIFAALIERSEYGADWCPGPHWPSPPCPPDTGLR